MAKHKHDHDKEKDHVVPWYEYCHADLDYAKRKTQSFRITSYDLVITIADPSLLLPCFTSSIWEAARLGETTRLQSILQSTRDVNVRDESGYTALHYAARNGKLEAVAALLSHGADANACTKAQQATALHRASYCGHLAIVELLLKQGRATIDAADADGHTALFHAVSQGHIEVTKSLLLHRADPHRTDNSGVSLYALLATVPSIAAMLSK